MGILDHFHEKNLVEKVTLLTRIEQENQQETIPELIELCKIDDPDDQALFMAENTLRALLMKNELQTIRGLSSKNGKIRKICFQVIQRKKYRSASPVLISLLTESPPLDDDEMFRMLSALSVLHAIDAIDLFRNTMSHGNPMIAELAIETIGNYGDTASVPNLSGIVQHSESSDNLKTCDLITASAIYALGKIRNPEAILFLSASIHHKNPNTRRVIHQMLVEMGEPVVPEISKHFDQDDIDAKIMTANILGLIGGKKAGDALVGAIDKGASNHPNISFAIYEALGNIPSMKSLVCLADGLKEQDEMVLVAVISSIERQINPGVIHTLKKYMAAHDDQSKRLIKAIVTSKAVSIFESLYEEDKTGKVLIEAISASNDRDIISQFLEKLKSISTERAAQDAASLAAIATKRSNRNILAVDDSKAMILFYQSTISEMGHGVQTALNGQEAALNIEDGKVFDLVITDMNMPVMNGIELSQKIRAHETMGSVPILMATTESERSQVEKAQKAGVTHFIIKPFSAEDLKITIQTILKIEPKS